MMNSLTDGLKAILGEPDFYINNAWDYGAMLEYFFGAVILCICVASIFRCVYVLIGGRRR